MKTEETNILTPRKAINKAFLKIATSKDAITKFKGRLTTFLDLINESETEEHNKKLITDFLSGVYYETTNSINTKGRADLVIHNNASDSSPVAVIIEVKRPGKSNSSEMIHKDDLNAKALQELLLYYLRERIEEKNIDLKHLIVTNIYEWFIFDVNLFEKLFAQNTELVNKFNTFVREKKSTDFFYKEIASDAIDKLKDKMVFTHFDIRDYDQKVRIENSDHDSEVVALYKLLSPQHLLKLPFANDSNSLDKTFYTELLHIIGLTEVKDGSKKLIQRKKQGERNPASLLESAIFHLDELDKISLLPNPSAFGENKEERLFNVSLELCITWINRILFLKLLEAQLLKYHKGKKEFAFLNTEKIKSFADLNKLFFSVLARRPIERSDEFRKVFEHVPYLNSSLFEPTEIEQVGVFINQLEKKELAILSTSVFKNDDANKHSTELPTIEYIIKFLDAYDFSSEGSDEIREDNKRLINASVLGLIFEKINGYKDGSFFTPGFITMYMCRETIRRTVLQKFNEAYGWNCKEFSELVEDIKQQIKDDSKGRKAVRRKANAIINEIKICDSAVGSGHFLVSALNELICIKSELNILVDKDFEPLNQYSVEVVNDELIVTSMDDELFAYNPTNKESQRIQETLFHEKQTIIENCLFGVDLNPNSVKICQLRLWIELLKNAYYKSPDYTELETLPNIDINIKCGNSLISRYALDADIKEALKKSKWSIESYRIAVMTYRNAKSKEVKQEMKRLIDQIKNDFESEIAVNDKRLVKLKKTKNDLFTLTNQTVMFERTKSEAASWNKQVKALTETITNLENELADIKSNKIYENAFEWRFEFPEILNDEGEFVGFDVVIGNPPYIRQEEIKEQKQYLQNNYRIFTGTADIYVFFVEKGFEIIQPTGNFCYIMPNKWMQTGYGKPMRSFLLEKQLQSIVDFGDIQVFEEATTYPCILNASRLQAISKFKTAVVKTLQFDGSFEYYLKSIETLMNTSDLSPETWIVSSDDDRKLLNKIRKNSITLFDYVNGKANYGIKTGLTEAFLIDCATKERLILEDERSKDLIKPFLLGRNIKPYSTTKSNNWLILIPKGFTIKRNLPSNDINSVCEAMPRYGNMHINEAWNLFRENYPAIARYLLPFKTKAEARTDQGDFWWELRACDYYKEFEKPKIMYQVLQVKPCFIYDDKGQYCNNSMWIIPKADKFLVGLLNSKMGWWLVSKYCTAIQNGYQLIWQYFGQIPISKGDSFRNEIILKVDNVIKNKEQNIDTHSLESEIDQLVYQLYCLTEEEIKIVEGTNK